MRNHIHRLLWTGKGGGEGLPVFEVTLRFSGIDRRLERTAARRCMLNCSPVMAISKDLLDILVCPLCKAPVELKQDENGLKCVQCKRVYPIRDDIPVMLVDEARIEE
jgi:hypothetical protein